MSPVLSLSSPSPTLAHLTIPLGPSLSASFRTAELSLFLSPSLHILPTSHTFVHSFCSILCLRQIDSPRLRLVHDSKQPGSFYSLILLLLRSELSFSPIFIQHHVFLFVNSFSCAFLSTFDILYRFSQPSRGVFLSL